MADGPTYRVAYKRKRKGLTNYKKRLRLLKSEKNRFVIRKSNNSMQCQIIEYKNDGDRTLVAANSLILPKYGYKGHTGNIPAAYLAGYMCGLKAKKKGIKEAILDLGLNRSTKGSRLYAAMKGMNDAGVKVKHNEKVNPEERRIQGYHIANYAQILNSKNPEEYEKRFAKVLERKLVPEKMVEHFAEVKKRLSGEFA